MSMDAINSGMRLKEHCLMSMYNIRRKRTGVETRVETNPKRVRAAGHR